MGKKTINWGVFENETASQPVAYFWNYWDAEAFQTHLRTYDMDPIIVQFTATHAMWRALFRNGWLVREEVIKAREKAREKTRLEKTSTYGS